MKNDGTPSVLLIHPPVAKPCEPPAGIAKLSAALGSHGIEHRLLDASIEGLLFLLKQPLSPDNTDDAWTKRAFRNCGRNLSLMRTFEIYRHRDRYTRAVRDLGKVLAHVSPSATAVGLVNYEHEGLSPVRSGDLLAAAERPELSPFYPYFRSRLEELFREKVPTVAGISLNYLSQALCAFSMIGFLRREFPALEVILGGGLVTTWLRNPGWKNPFRGLVDHLVAGPGEYRLLRLLGLNPENEKRSCPDYSALSHYSYLSPGFILPYSASSGCYWSRCGFCPEKAEANPYVPIPARQAVRDLRDLSKKNGPVLIHLLDNAISPALLDALAGDMIGVPWYGFSRIGPEMTDPDFCMALKRSGCAMLKLGIESGDQAVLDAMQKGISVETASAALKNLKRAGIAAYVYFIFGTPAESEESARKTLAFTVRHSDNIDFLNLAIFNMPVCGDAAPEIETRGFYEGDLSLYTDFSHPKGWDRKRVRLFLENEFKKNPAVSAILKKEPPVFTSNHAPFFVMGDSERDRQ